MEKEIHTTKKLNEAKAQKTKKIKYRNNIRFKLFNLNNEEKNHKISQRKKIKEILWTQEQR